jgi:hypothetical protein
LVERRRTQLLSQLLCSAHNTHWVFFFLHTFYGFIFIFFFFSFLLSFSSGYFLWKTQNIELNELNMNLNLLKMFVIKQFLLLLFVSSSGTDSLTTRILRTTPTLVLNSNTNFSNKKVRK